MVWLHDVYWVEEARLVETDWFAGNEVSLWERAPTV